MAAEHNALDNGAPPAFATLREAFAVAWHRAGLPVPYDYDASDDALPLLPEDREYLAVRGKGDRNRVLRSVVPRSLRGDNLVVPFDTAQLQLHEINLRTATSHSIVLCFVAMQTVPLVFAYLNGFSLLGANFSLPTHRSIGLAIATRWAERAISAASSTF